MTENQVNTFRTLRAYPNCYSTQMVLGILGKPKTEQYKGNKAGQIEKTGKNNCWYFFNFLNHFDLFPMEDWNDIEWQGGGTLMEKEQKDFIISLYRYFHENYKMIKKWKSDHCGMDEIQKQIEQLKRARVEAGVIDDIGSYTQELEKSLTV